MPRASNGTYSLPNSPVITGTPITATDENTTRSDIASELTNSLDRGGRGAMTAPLQLASGTVAAPGLSFSADADCGLYRIGANDIALAAGGSKVVEATTTGVVAPLGVTVTQSQSNTAAISATGNGSAAGLRAYAGTAATATTQYAAIAAENGAVTFNGTAPNSTVGFSNAMVGANVPKAWANITTTGATFAATVNGGFNIASAARTANNTMRVTFATALANANFAVTINEQTSTGTQGWARVAAKNTAYIDIKHMDNTSADVNIDGSTITWDFVVFGLQ